MKKPIVFVIIIFSLAMAATYYPWQQTEETESILEKKTMAKQDNYLKIPEANKKIIIKYPVPETTVESEGKRIGELSAVEQEPVANTVSPDPVVPEAPKPLPQLDESDRDVADAINRLTDVTGLFSFKNFIRHFVVTIDNLTNQKIPQRYIFTQRVPDKFAVITKDVDTALLDTRNFIRYAGFVNLAERIDTGKLVAHYVRFYPLFQEAYEELGYPDRYFNDRLIQVIDHLLDAPEVEGQINLVRPKVFYQFANPELEALSAGQKILVRVGYDNAQRVKAKLRELRTVLTKLSVQ